MEKLLEDLLSTQTQDYGACVILLLLMLAPQWWQRHKQDGEFVAFRFEILPDPKLAEARTRAVKLNLRL
ncbi:MAG TPA: hypothetical protein VHT02_07935 [Methylocella sp.]|nr:hypothetical protein [Methylocella sp.]